MKRIKTFLSLSAEDRKLLLKAWCLLWVVRLGLWAFPFAWIRWASRRVSHPVRRLAGDPPSVTRIGWAVNIASRYVPLATHCLTRAISTEILLRRRGYAAELCYGVRRTRETPFIAHAWVESEGVVVIGGGPDLTNIEKLMPHRDKSVSAALWRR